MMLAYGSAQAQCPSSHFIVDVQGLYPPKSLSDVITVTVEFGPMDSWSYTINQDQNTVVSYPSAFGAPTSFVIMGTPFTFPIPGAATIPDPAFSGGCYLVVATLDAAGCLTLTFTPC